MEPAKSLENNFFYKEKLEKLQARRTKMTKAARRKRSDSDDEEVVSKRPKGLYIISFNTYLITYLSRFNFIVIWYKQIPGKKTSWTTEEKDAVKAYVQEYPLPSKVSSAYINAMQAMYPELKNRGVMIIRAFITNSGLRQKNT